MEVIPPMIPPMLKQAELTSPKGVLFRPLNPPTGNPVLAKVSYTRGIWLRIWRSGAGSTCRQSMNNVVPQ